jgi:hypothetical protein
LIQEHRIFRPTGHRASGLLLYVLLAGLQANAADPGYPPPPGAYRSERAAHTEPARPPAPAKRPGSAGGEPDSTQGRSRLLPLPEEMFGAKPERYDADTLFGSSVPVVQRPSEGLEQADGQPAASTGPDRFAPQPRPAEPMSGYTPSPMDGSRGSQPAPATQVFRTHGGSAQAGYPPHSSGYPAYQPPYQGPYYPGAATGYAPAIRSPGYLDRYAPGYPQTGGMPAQRHYPAAAPNAAGHVPDSRYAPGYGYTQGDEADGVAPLSAPAPNRGDASVFRPPE